MRRFVAMLSVAAVSAAAAPVPVAGAVGSSPTAKFVRKVDKTCAQSAEWVAGLPEITDKNIHHVLATEAGILASLAKRLKAITPPQPKKAKYTSFVKATQEQSTLIRKALKAAKKKKGAKAKVAAALREAVDAGDRAGRLASEIGVDACVSDFTPGVG